MNGLPIALAALLLLFVMMAAVSGAVFWISIFLIWLFDKALDREPTGVERGGIYFILIVAALSVGALVMKVGGLI